MSMFGDYKSYKKFAPEYSDWKYSRDLADAKRQEYLRQNPSELNQDDVKKSKALLRAIDIMDEYSQKRSEDMEVATENIVGIALEIALSIGAAIGYGLTKFKPVQNFLNKFAKGKNAVAITGMVIGGALATCAAFPLFAWASKTEVGASRKGRFEAMRKELDNPKVFATLTDEQEKELEQILDSMPANPPKKGAMKSVKEQFELLKNMAVDSKEYKQQRRLFELEVLNDKKHFDTELSEEEIENAKKDKQLLTKLVEKIDIASQDYAENTELATSTLMSSIFAFGSLFSLGYAKLASKYNWKGAHIPSILSAAATIVTAMFAASIQKEASRVGRFKVKQELIKNPEQLVYVNDEKIEFMPDVEVKSHKKPGFFKFLKEAWENNKEYKQWKKTEGSREKNMAKALKNIELDEKQIKDAKRLQKNTFKTFNKIDENSQKYSESIEAIGSAIQYPVNLLFTGIGAFIGTKSLAKAFASKGSTDKIAAFARYMIIILASAIPSIGINAYVTKQQKKASRVADMLAIKEMNDYRNFADYSKN